MNAKIYLMFGIVAIVCICVALVMDIMGRKGRHWEIGVFIIASVIASFLLNSMMK